MLVLTRKPGETVQIGNDIVITVLRTARGAIRLGIEAPLSVPILRGELRDRIEAPASCGHCQRTPSNPSSGQQPAAS